MVDGVFARAFKSSLRPIELGRRMLRDMDENRSVDVRGRRIVPNDFTFWLSPTDHAAFAEIDETLMAELAEAARQYAREENYFFLGPVSVELTVENALKPGRFRLTSQMKEPHGPARAGNLVLPTRRAGPAVRPPGRHGQGTGVHHRRQRPQRLTPPRRGAAARRRVRAWPTWVPRTGRTSTAYGSRASNCCVTVM